MRIIIIALLTTLTLLSAKPQRLAAANPAGDADNDGTVTLADAALIQALLYGTVTTANISPLALTGADTTVSLDDLLLAAQAAGLVRTGLTPPTGILSISVPPVPLVVASGQTPNPVIDFAVISAYPGAGDINGLQVGSFTILEAAESTLTNPDAFVTTNLAGVELVPLNTTGTDDNLTIRLEVPIHDSEGTLVETLTGDFPVTVTAACTPIVCPALPGSETITVSETGLTNIAPGGWSTFANSLFNGNSTVRSNVTTAVYTGEFDVQNTTIDLYVWALGLIPVSGGAASYEVQVDGTPVGVFDGTASGNPNHIEWQEVTGGTPVNLAAGTHTLGARPVGSIYAYIDGAILTSDPAYDPNADPGLLPIAGTSVNLDDPAHDEYTAGSTGTECCGDCIVQAGEVCDDGNTDSCDGCAADCTVVEGCGDGSVNCGETCDDGDTDPCTATCNATCTGPAANVCGDGIAECGEICDASLPYNPSFVAEYDTAGDATGLAVSGDRLYLCDGNDLSGGRFLVFDIAGPTPALLSSNTVGLEPWQVAIDGNYAYVADRSGQNLEILDISVSPPTAIGNYTASSDSQGVAIDGSRAYLATLDDLQVLDIATTPPTFLGSYNNVGNYAVAVDTGRAFLGHDGGLDILDIGSPDPVLIDRYDSDSLAVYDVFISGGRAYLAASWDSFQQGLYILDISQPTPVYVGSYSTPGYTGAVTISGNRAYLSAGNDGLFVLDITTPNPTLIGQYNTPGFAYDSSIQGRYAYVADYDLGGLQVLDIAEPCTSACDLGVCGDGIVETGETCDDGNALGGDGCSADCLVVEYCGNGVLDFGEACDDGDTDPCSAGCNADCSGPAANTCGDGLVECGEVCDDGDTLSCGGCTADCLAIEGCGDTAVNCGETCDALLPHNPTFVGEYDTPGNAYGVYVSGNRAYVADYHTSLEVFDIATDTPALIGSWDALDVAYDVFVNGNRAYVVDEFGLQVLDISTATPTFVGAWDAPDYANDVFVSGTRAYVADHSSGLQVLDISTDTPTFVGAYDTPGRAYGVFIAGARAYVADDNTGGLQVLDISTPTPTFVGSYDTPGYARGVFVSGNRAYVADGPSGLQVLDISTDTPTFVGAYDTPQDALGVFVSGSRAYVADTYSGLQVLDVSTPTPTFVGAYDTPGRAYDVVVSGARAYVADFGSGLQVLDISEPCTDSCTFGTCGDDIVVTGEACDDGNTLDGDGCRGDCSALEFCGNGTLDPGETCDDGDLDPCTAACNFDCSGPAANVCGDGLRECGETCDDGDTDNCTTDCDSTCSGPHTVVCGDGITECGETCDDGDTDNCTATCDATCTGPYPLVCGDGLTECGEICDDGNTLDCDGCLGDCSGPSGVCGDGVIECGEVCDYGAGPAPANGCTVGDVCDGDCLGCSAPGPTANPGVRGSALSGTMTVCAVDSRTLAAIPDVEVMVGDAYSASLHCTTDATGCCSITDPALNAPPGGIDVTFARVGYPYTTFSDITVDTVVARLDMLPGRRALDTGAMTASDNTALVEGQFDTTTLDLIHAYRERHGPPIPNPLRAALVVEALHNPEVADLNLATLLAPNIPKEVTIGSITTEMPIPAGMVAPDLVSSDSQRWQTALTGAGTHLLVALGLSIQMENIDLGDFVGYGSQTIQFETFTMAVIEADLAPIDIPPSDLSATGFVDADARIGRSLALGTIDFGSTWSDNRYWRIWEGGSLSFTRRHRMIVSDLQGPEVPNGTVRAWLGDVSLSGTIQPHQISATVTDPDTGRVNRCQNVLNGAWSNCLFDNDEHQGFMLREGDGIGERQEGLWLAGYELLGGDFDGQLVPFGIANRAFVECGGVNTTGNTCYASVPFGEPTTTGEASILSITGANGVTRQSVAAHYKPEPRGTGVWDRDESNHDLANGYRLGLDIDDAALALPYGTDPGDPGAGIDGDQRYLCGTDQEDACCAAGTCDFEAWDIDLRTLTFGTTAYPRKADLYTMKLGLGETALDSSDNPLLDERRAGECSNNIAIPCITDADCAGNPCNRPELPVGDIWTIYSATEGAVNLPDISGLPQGPGDGRIGTYDDRHIFGDATLGATNPGINSTGNWTPQVNWTILGRGGEGMPSTYTWNNWSFSDLDGAESFSINKQEMYWEGN